METASWDHHSCGPKDVGTLRHKMGGRKAGWTSLPCRRQLGTPLLPASRLSLTTTPPCPQRVRAKQLCFCCLLTADSSSLSRPPSPLPRALAWAAHTEEADKWPACSDKEAPGVTVGGALCPHYLSWPLHQLTPQLWFCFGFLFFFGGRGGLKKCQCYAQHLWISKHERRPVSIFWREEKKVRGTTQHSLRP